MQCITNLLFCNHFLFSSRIYSQDVGHGPFLFHDYTCHNDIHIVLKVEIRMAMDPGPGSDSWIRIFLGPKILDPSGLYSFKIDGSRSRFQKNTQIQTCGFLGHVFLLKNTFRYFNLLVGFGTFRTTLDCIMLFWMVDCI